MALSGPYGKVRTQPLRICLDLTPAEGKDEMKKSFNLLLQCSRESGISRSPRFRAGRGPPVKRDREALKFLIFPIAEQSQPPDDDGAVSPIQLQASFHGSCAKAIEPENCIRQLRSPSRDISRAGPRLKRRGTWSAMT